MLYTVVFCSHYKVTLLIQVTQLTLFTSLSQSHFIFEIIICLSLPTFAELLTITMANVTDPLARTVHGKDPQNLIEYITRQKIYDSIYWKEECFGLSATDVHEFTG